MCLFDLKNVDKQIAEEDITVLKVIKNYKGKKCSPVFDNEVWKVGEEKTVDLGVIKNGFDYPEILYRTTTGFYSFDKDCDPKYCALVFMFCERREGDLEVYEAIIPKGAEYVKKGGQYCSNKLKLVKQIV